MLGVERRRSWEAKTRKFIILIVFEYHTADGFSHFREGGRGERIRLCYHKFWFLARADGWEGSRIERKKHCAVMQKSCSSFHVCFILHLPSPTPAFAVKRLNPSASPHLFHYYRGIFLLRVFIEYYTIPRDDNKFIVFSRRWLREGEEIFSH